MKTIITSLILIIFSSFIGIASKIYFYDKYIYYNIEQERYDFEKSTIFTKSSLYKYAAESDQGKEFLINFDSVSTISVIKIKLKNEYNEIIKGVEIDIPALLHHKYDFLMGSCSDECEYSFGKENIHIKIKDVLPISDKVYLFYFSGVSFFEHTWDEKFLIYTNDNKELKKYNSWYNLSYVLSFISFETFFIILLGILILTVVILMTWVLLVKNIKEKFENQILEDKDLEVYIKVKKLIDKILK